ncbi:tubulin monoglutamylase TTLL4 isoform X3 [Hydra vulgaris]|uniref:tubulin monoglutamylase TTLL4 isoform X3 n=1 Tax=Hydra vulgaris TaxID=6087 RepID=UPI001F5F6A6F|nr:tubulin monoglutamylase TTLL4 isoform X3 [Hydra vulgaris]
MNDSKNIFACEKDYSGIDDKYIFEKENMSLLENISSLSLQEIEAIHSRLLDSANELDEERHKIPLLKSLFSNVAPTLYFMLDQEKVGCFPAEVCDFLKWKFCKITPKVVRDCVKRTGFKMTKKNPNWLGLWGKHMKSIEFRTICIFQKVNHFPGTFQIGRKDKLWKNFSRFQTIHGEKNFNFMPQTFILPNDLCLLRRQWRERKRKWIVKPPASARGKGIKIISSWEELPKKQFLVVQRYIINPYLINGCKFDLRVYVYVSCFDPLRVYIFNDGLVRFATRKYSARTATLSDKYIHLTNYSVNKQNKKVYKQPGIENNNLSHKCGEYLVNSQARRNTKSRYNCHELFGFDIILDSNLKPWLLEVNISPSLQANSSTDLNIKSQLVKDLLNIAGFRLPKFLLPFEISYFGDDFNCSKYFIPNQSLKNAKNLLLKSLSPDDIKILIEAEDELSRSGCFERIFPSTSSKPYLNFFKSCRHYNLLLDKWTQLYMRDTFQPLAGIRLLKSLTDIQV